MVDLHFYIMSQTSQISPNSIWKRLRNQEIDCDKAIELLVDKRGGLRIDLLAHVTQKPKKVSETAIPSEIAAKP